MISAEEKFNSYMERITEKEKVLDGTCAIELYCGYTTRPFLEKLGLLRRCGEKGRTRIVIEYDNDTGWGYKRIVGESETTVGESTPKDQKDNRHPDRNQDDPNQNKSCNDKQCYQQPSEDYWRHPKFLL